MNISREHEFSSTRHSEMSALLPVAGAPALSAAFLRQPSHSKISIIEATRNRLVICLPPASGPVPWAMTTGFVAFMILGSLFSILALILGPANGRTDVMTFTLIVICTIIIILCARSWIRAHFRTIIELERGRLIVRNSLFGFSKVNGTELRSDARAKLAFFQRGEGGLQTPPREDWCDVLVTGRDQSERFAAGLQPDEKAWLVNVINAFLSGRPSAPEA